MGNWYRALDQVGTGFFAVLRSHSGVALLRIRILVRKPGIPTENPKTLGEHLALRRHTMGCMQKEVAALMGVNEWTYLLWESDRNEPMVRMWPKVIGFLGYDPNGEPRTDGEALMALRRRFGLSRKRLAKIAGCDEATVGRLENGPEDI